MNKVYKIGRYFYEEITEEEYVELRREAEDRTRPEKYYSTVFTLTDIDGEPIKFFKRVKRSLNREEANK